MPNKKKKYSARFPPARIKKIMQKDDEVGKVAAAVPVIISRSLELFVESLIKKTNNLVVSRNARTLTPQHIKQTVLLESEFKFLHELVSTIPDVQSTEEEQPSTYLSQQPHAHEASAARPTPDLPSVVATTNSTASTGNITKPGGKQRGRPRKTKTDEVKPSKAKKQKLAATVEDGDSEETCSGSEEENKELNDQSKRGRKASAGQKSNSSKLAHHPSSHSTNCTTLPNTVLFSPSISTGPNSQTFVNDAFQMLELPISSKVVEAYMTLNGGASANPPLVSSQQVPNVQQNVPVISSNDEALDLSTSGGKNGDMRIRKDVPEGETQNKALCIPRTFYMTNILNANIQTMSQPALNEASQNKPQLQGEAYKLNIPKISVQTGSPLVKSDLISPGISLQGCRPSLSQPLSNYDLSQGQPINQAIRPMVASQAIPYQIQNVAQKSHPAQVIFSHMQGPELNQNLAADAQFFNAGSPVRLLQYPRFMSLVPGASSFAGVKSPPSSSQTGGNAAAAAPSAEEQKVVPRCESLSTKDSADDKQS